MARVFNLRVIQRQLIQSLLVMIILMTVFIAVNLHEEPTLQIPTWSESCTSSENTFVCNVASRASSDKFIILAVVDEAFIDLAFNLYESSFRPHGINNFLFVGMGHRVCRKLQAASLPCVQHAANISGYESASTFNRAGFFDKVFVKVEVMVETLASEFTALLIDVDVVFLRNPIPQLKIASATSDMAAMMDTKAYNNPFNSGFIIVKPTTCSIEVWKMTRQIMLSSHLKVNDQQSLYYAIRNTVDNNITGCGAMNIVQLDTVLFANGEEYFEIGGRLFPINESECAENGSSRCPLVVHNNFFLTLSAKIYRFKEHLMWAHDKDGYYSSVTTKYLVYENPVRSSWSLSSDGSRDQLNALESALAIGRIIGRVVILPRFHCQINDSFFDCPLNSLIAIAPFDSIYDTLYRESSFLLNKKVPSAVRGSVSTLRNIVTHVTDVSVVKVKSAELIDMFKSVTETVLALGPLYDVFMDFSTDRDKLQWLIAAKATNTFRRCDYRQKCMF